MEVMQDLLFSFRQGEADRERAHPRRHYREAAGTQSQDAQDTGNQKITLFVN